MKLSLCGIFHCLPLPLRSKYTSQHSVPKYSYLLTGLNNFLIRGSCWGSCSVYILYRDRVASPVLQPPTWRTRSPYLYPLI
jgi:hypothetical protein